jgi:hypothetical protein
MLVDNQIQFTLIMCWLGHKCMLFGAQMYAICGTSVCWLGHKYVLVGTQVCAGWGTSVCWFGPKCVLVGGPNVCWLVAQMCAGCGTDGC